MSDPNLKFIKETCELTLDRLTNCIRVQETFPWAYDQAQDALKVEEVTYTIRSDKDDATNGFNRVCNVGAFINGNLVGMASNKAIITRVKLQFDVQRAWRTMLWKKDGFEDVDLDLDAFCATVNFVAANLFQYGGANQFYVDSGDLYIVYEDIDGTYEAHFGAQNNGPGNKAAAANDEGIIELEYRPTS